jgi:hypothetical protein
MKDGREGQSADHIHVSRHPFGVASHHSQRLYRQPELLINTEGLLGHSQNAGSIFVLQDGRAAQAYILS